MGLIEKSIVVEEIERKRNYEVQWMKRQGYTDYHMGLRDGYDDILYFLDNLEVKEVGLDESARNYLLHEHISPLNAILHQADLKAEMQYHKDIENAYKAGFELGLKA